MSEQVAYLRKMHLLPEQAVHLSWLTCAHVYGFVMEIVCIAVGGKIGYWQVSCVANGWSGDDGCVMQGKVDKLMDDIAALKPTQFFAVPRVWTRIMDTATRKIESRGTVTKCVGCKPFPSSLANEWRS